MKRSAPLKDLQVGDHLLAAFNENDTLVISDYFIRHEKELERLEKLGVKKATVANDRMTERLKAQTNPIKQMKKKIEKEPTKLGKTQILYKNTLREIKDIFTDIHDKKSVDPEKLIPYINEIIDYAHSSPASIAVLTQLEEYDFDTFRHSVNVSLLSILYGRHHNYSHRKLVKLAFGAMLHDVGKIFLPKKIVTKPNRLSEEEYEIVKSHPDWGYEVLAELDVDETIRKMAYEHHERPDKSGYPEGTNIVHPFSRIISVLDVYDALTSQRIYKERLAPTRAFFLLNQEFGDYPETQKIVKSLLRCLGLFPIGSLVKLTNKDIAVVKKSHPDDLIHPVVTVLEMDDENRIKESYDVNLKATQDNKSIHRGKLYDNQVEVKEVLSIEKIREIESQDIFEVLKQRELREATIV
ncbi:MAG: HD-GYP domain-containing protein [bacterium]